jgi:glutaconate CoA-transferase subunit A
MLRKYMDEDKRMTAKEAVERFVGDGDSMVIGNCLYATPYALLHEVIRQRRKNLTVFQQGGIDELDQLILGECVSKLIIAYNFRIAGERIETVLERALRRGEVEIEDYSNYTLLAMLQAGAMGYPFLPVMSGIRESDVCRVERFCAGQKFGEVECPFTGEKVAVVRGRNPDVAVMHVQRADKSGNAQLWGALINTKWACLASSRVIVSCEHIVDEEVIRSSPHLTIVPGFRVCAVVEEPWGAHPSELLGFYDYDMVYRSLLFMQTMSEEGGKAFMDEWVYGVEDRQAYLQHYADRFGLKYLNELKARPYLSAPADYGATWRRAWDDNDVSFNFQMNRGEFLQALEEKGGFTGG